MAKTLREKVKHCSDRLTFVARLAGMAAGGSDPRVGAEYLADVLEELGPTLRSFRPSAGRHPRRGRA